MFVFVTTLLECMMINVMEYQTIRSLSNNGGTIQLQPGVANTSGWLVTVRAEHIYTL